jgi:aryl-alcohol dehydrogenase-like predicted oxidoreductase
MCAGEREGEGIEMDRRRIGRSDVEVSVIGMGGIVLAGREQADADRHVAESVARGVTYFDVAPSYGDAEQRLGPALEPYRDEVVLACKTGKRTADESREELERSLRRLRTDRLDIYQMHGLCRMEEVEQALGPGGAIETFRKAKEEGLTRLIGFSAHSDAVALRAMACGQFDTVLFPLNYLSLERNGFGRDVLAAAGARGMGILAIKSMARTKVGEGADRRYEKCWYVPEDRPGTAQLQLRYTLSLPGVAAAIPPGEPELFELALEAPRLVEPLSEEETARLRADTAQFEPLWDAQ